MGLELSQFQIELKISQSQVITEDYIIVMMMILMIMMMAAPQERGHHDCRQGAENEIQEAGGGSRNRQTKSQRQGAVIFTMRADAEKSIVFHLQFTLT